MVRIQHELLHPHRRIRLAGVIHDLLEPVVRDDVEPVHGDDACTRTVGESQAATDRLLDKCARIRGAQRDDRIKVRHVPAFLQHVDVDHDLSEFLGVLDPK